MVVRHPLALGVLFLLGTGCAYSSAMGRGARSEKSEEWVEALTAYDKALTKKPADPQASAARKRALDRLVDDTLQKTADQIAIGEFEAAMETLAIGPRFDGDRPEVYALTQHAQESMQARYQALFAATDKRPAYEMAVRTRALFPDSPHVDPALAELRMHYMVTAGQQAAEHQYPQAQATLRTILDYEPEKAGDIAEQEKGLVEAWGKHLAELGSSTRSKQPGAAAVWYARAYEVTPNPDYLEASRAIVERLAPEGPLPVTLSVTGDRRRTTAFRESLKASLSSVPDVKLVTRSAELGIRVVVKTSRCTEAKTVMPTSVEYVSGQTEQPSPEWNRIAGDIGMHQQNAAAAADRAAAMQADFFLAEQAIANVDSQIAGANRELAAANQAVNEARAQLEASNQYMYRLQGDLAAHESAGAWAYANQVRGLLGPASAAVTQWNGELQRRQEYAGRVQQQLQGLHNARVPAVNQAVNVKAAMDGAVFEQQSATQQAAQLAGVLASTPKTIWVDERSTHTYDLIDWTRTCSAPASITLRPSWEARIPLTAEFAPTQETRDRAHRAFAKGGVPNDPKKYPEKDAALVARGDAATLGELAGLLKAAADDHFMVRSQAARMALAADPEGGTTELVRLWVGARGRVDEATMAAFEAHLKTYYGLQDTALLTPL